MQPELFSVKGQRLWLSPDRTIFWEEEKALIASDLHFGKTGHFRKSGIAVPQSVYKEDLQRLVSQIQFYQPKQLIAVGDLFHSRENKELDLFRKWRNDFAELIIHLVRGNHDILHNNWYNETNILVTEGSLKMDPFCFRHDLESCDDDDGDYAMKHYLFSGHIHPGITISGPAKQSLRFPCFYFTDTFCVLPAFSRFTGSISIKPNNNETVFAIVNHSIIRIA